MSIIAPEHGGSGINSGSVERKTNVAKKLRVSKSKASKSTAASRASANAPEVMAKVTGFSKGKSHSISNIEYVSRNGDLEIETDRGEMIKGRTELKAFAKDWTQEFNDKKTYKNQRDTAHLILSMPPGTDPEAVRNATRNFAKREFGGNHEYVFALHTDTKSPHCHLTIKCLGNDGKRLNPRKADLQRYREGFARAMEEQGVMANATPRRVRGVVKKPERQVLRHIEKRGVSKVKALKVKELAAELVAEEQGKPTKPKPWVKKIEDTQQRIRAAWLARAERLLTRTGKDKEDYSNDRPDYDRLDRRRVRQLQRSAGLYQSRDNAPGGSGSAEPFASMRNLPRRVMVQEQTPKVLLHQDAQHRLGDRNGTRPGDDLRRSGNGVDGATGRTRKEVKPEQPTNRDLAEQIKEFVSHMPPVETERDAMKRELKTRFEKQREVERPTQSNSVAEPATDKRSFDKDPER